jgi:hypothetical protein
MVAIKKNLAPNNNRFFNAPKIDTPRLRKESEARLLAMICAYVLTVVTARAIHFLIKATVALVASTTIVLKLVMKYRLAFEKLITAVQATAIPLIIVFTIPCTKVMIVCCFIIIKADRKVARIVFVIMTKLLAKN